jgi:hypothetical protein
MRSWSFVIGLVVAACGSNPAPQAGAPSATTDADAAVPASADDAGPPAAARPLAKSAAEATQLIQQALDTKTDAVQACVKQFRFRKHLAHERVDIAVGIDQEGHVLGVTLPKRQPDDELTKCVQSAVHDAPFPRSHSGVITVTRSFEEMVR